MGLLIAFVIAQSVWLSKHMTADNIEPTTEPKGAKDDQSK
jgi:hypothetical protein